jgi:hypothetical protein
MNVLNNGNERNDTSRLHGLPMKIRRIEVMTVTGGLDRIVFECSCHFQTLCIGYTKNRFILFKEHLLVQ